MADRRDDVRDVHESEQLMRSPTSKKPYIDRQTRNRVANILSDVRRLLVELDKMNLRDATEECKRLRRELKQKIEEEDEYIRNIYAFL